MAADDKKFESVKRSKLIELLAQKQKIPQDEAREAVKRTLSFMIDKFAEGKRVEIRRFGSFSLRTHKEKITRNLKATDVVLVAERKSVYFSPSTALKERVNNSRLDNAASTAPDAPAEPASTVPDLNTNSLDTSDSGALSDLTPGDKDSPFTR